MTGDKYIEHAVYRLCRNEERYLPILSSSLMEVDKDDVLKEDDVIGSPPVVKKRINSSCKVDDESDSPHDDLSDGVTLAAADSTTPEVDTCFRKVHSYC